MFDQTKLEADLIVDEDKLYRRYLDTKGHWTIGIGHNLDVSPLPTGWVEPLSDAQVDTLFNRDIAGTLSRLDARLPGWRNYPEVVSRIIADMAFNMGVGQRQPPSGLLQFTTFLSLVAAGRYDAAADDLTHTLWHRQVGSRATRIEALLRSAA